MNPRHQMSKSQRKEARKKERIKEQGNQFTCFFTGLVLHRTDHRIYGYSIEHLVPRASLKSFHQCPNRRKHLDRIHRVDAATIINSYIGHAPLSVKYGLREYLRTQEEVEFFPKMTPAQRVQTYAILTQKFLARYHVDVDGKTVRLLPWYWESAVNPKIKLALFKAQWALLTPEEKALTKVDIEARFATMLEHAKKRDSGVASRQNSKKEKTNG